MYIYSDQYYSNGDRQFLFPFLVGAVTGGAAIGLTRPRPIYNVAPVPMNNQMGPYPYGYNYNFSYNYPPYPFFR